MSVKDLLSQDEIDALLHGADDSADSSTDDADDGEDADGVRAYDLASNDRVVRGRMPTLELINERFARNARNSIYNLLRSAADVAVEDVQFLKYGDYIHTLYVPSSMCVMRVEPFKGAGLFILDAKLVFKLVDNFYGGDGRHAKIEGRDFTPTENRLVFKLLESFFRDLHDAWEPVVALKFKRVGHEVNPSMANMINQSDVVVVSTFQVDLESGTSQFHVVYPYAMLEPIKDLLVSGSQKEESNEDERWQESLQRELVMSSVPLNMTIAQREVTLADIIELREGDVIPVEIPELLELKANRVPIFTCKLGTSRGNLAVKIVKKIDHTE
ncbi:MAG: flagellar motor switch protein [Osedax symbiont Rs1]|nr:MAG: flagellar motor switch protein [Osedax symbiont Rs1]